LGKVWWVSQNQTYDAEVGGGYLWSPKINSDGSYSRAYDNMTRIVAGDLVLSFAGSEIRAVGVAQGSARTEPRPPEFGKAGESWSKEGWLVPVQFSVLEWPYAPSEHMDLLRPLLPTVHSPLQPGGRGNQAYLFDVTGALGEALLELAGLQAAEGPVAEAAEHAIQNRTDIPATKKLQLIEARVGQGIFRANLERIEARCRVTGVSDRRFLVASHIKPWRASTDQEKLDGYNGLLLAPHVDRLFDRGLISFMDGGTILKHDSLPSTLFTAWGLDAVENVGRFDERQSIYLDYHRTRIFGLG
jgi:putative restriction endonuclease